MKEFYKDITMERNNRKKYIHIDRETGSNEIYAMLDEIESDTESDTENLLEDSDTGYISEEPVPDNKEENHCVLTPEATVYVENEYLDVEEPPSKKHQKKITALKWKQTSKFIKAKKCTLEANVLLDMENANPLQIFESTMKLNKLVKIICDQSNLYAAQNERELALLLKKYVHFWISTTSCRFLSCQI